MNREILINSSPQEIRVAIMENRLLSEVFIERKRDRGILGNIYKGRVLKVLPGMQAAFVDVGLPKAGFLYVADIQDLTEDYEEIFLEGSSTEAPLARSGMVQESSLPFIEEILRDGQEILVQVAKEPLGQKGVRLTNRIALPGRYLVFLPGEDHIGVSRRIVDEEERDRLRSLCSLLKPASGGLIIRTVGEGAEEEEFREDLEFLLKIWKKIKAKSEKSRAPHLIHSDLDILLKTVRDHLTKDISRLLIDDEEDHSRMLHFAQSFLPHLKSKIDLYRGNDSLFDAYDIEIELDKLLERKVWLKSGGYITIEPTEALTNIDVNTGKYVGRGNFEETIFKTNLEAVKEIACQLRLRNLGGIIIIDFIDMESEKHRERVYKTLENALKGDRANSKILKISELGLVEMTRKRSRPSIEKTLCQPCPYCKGKGQIKSYLTVAYEIIREIEKTPLFCQEKSMVIEAHPKVADALLEEERQNMAALEKKFGKNMLIKANNNFHLEEYNVTPSEEDFKNQP